MRMRRSEDFRRTVRGGVRVGRPTLVVHAGETTSPDSRTTTPDPPGVQVGFVVAKTVGNAVVRNRVRRRLRALAAAEVLRTSGPVLVVVRALPRAATAPDEVPTDFASAWPQAVAKLARRAPAPARAGAP
jgi:ribonuclease P protein component